MALLRLQNIQVAFGSAPVLDDVSVSIEPNERVCLIGRNGEGKSTLFKVITGEINPDDGERVTEKGLVIAQLQQEVPTDTFGKVFDIVASGLNEAGDLIKAFNDHNQAEDMGSESWLKKMQHIQQRLDEVNGWTIQSTIDTVISKLALSPDEEFSALSGGVKRRVLLAQALVQEPDILLLDEPTNHLDIASILWLENYLINQTNSSLIFITHDRAFLKKLATRIIELDRGRMSSWPGTYDNYLIRKEEALHAEETENALFDKKLAKEEAWIREGIKARRTRNEGRVRALKKMRKESDARRAVKGKATLSVELGNRSGKRIAEAEGLRYVLPNGRELIKDFSCFIMRGSKVGLVGPNGTGKTTLLNLLLGKLEPTDGKVIEGINLELAYFDQMRNQLDDNRTVMDNVDNGAERITINGSSRHVISYLKDFLFTPNRMQQPVSALSGGERNRLLLAKVFIKPSNVLVLDEPTNDLDVETLELLEELLINYEGTVIVVSHDRDFLNAIITSCIVFDGEGNVEEFFGNYEDWEKHNKETRNNFTKTIEEKKPKAKLETAPIAEPTQKKLSYKLQLELDTIPTEIETLDQNIQTVESEMADPEFFKQDHDKVTAKTAELSELQKTLEEKYERWEWLENQ